MIRPGDEWGTPTDATADRRVRGDDAALATVVAVATTEPSPPIPLVRFEPIGSNLGRAIGLGEWSTDSPASPRGVELLLDAIETSSGVAVNAVVVGVDPNRLRRHHRRRAVTVVVDGRSVFAGRATTVVIANGQFLDGADLVPRGHPGDGRVEVQVYALGPGERSSMRRRLPGGTHLPHPRIVTATGRRVEITTVGAWPTALDGHAAAPSALLQATVRPGAIRLLV